VSGTPLSYAHACNARPSTREATRHAQPGRAYGNTKSTIVKNRMASDVDHTAADVSRVSSLPASGVLVAMVPCVCGPSEARGEEAWRAIMLVMRHTLLSHASGAVQTEALRRGEYAAPMDGGPDDLTRRGKRMMAIYPWVQGSLVVLLGLVLVRDVVAWGDAGHQIIVRSPFRSSPHRRVKPSSG
jgi:hypothetical protein